MFKKINQVTFCLCTSLLIGSTAYAQQGFGTDTPSKASAIEMKSTNKGLLIPRIVLQSLTSFAPLAGENSLNVEKSNSLLVYNTESIVSENIDPGYYYWTTDGTTGSWKRLLADDDASALALAGDVTGSLGATKVEKIQGRDVVNTTPDNNQVLAWNGSAWTPTTITPAQISNSANVTAGSNKVNLGGTPEGAALQAFSVDVNEGNLTLSNIGGQVTNAQINQGEANQVLVTSSDGSTTAWVNQSTLTPTTTNELSIGTDLDATKLTSNVNGVSSTVDLASAITAGETLTSLSQDATDGVITYNPERGTATTADVVSKTASNLITFSNGAFLNAEAVQNIQRLTTVSGGGPISVSPSTAPGTGDINYTVNVSAATITSVGVVKPGTGLIVDTDGTLNATPATVTNTITGNKIADITTTSSTTAINETITTLSQDNTGITYVNENGGTGVTAKIVSTDTNNLITMGTDHGALLTSTNLETTLADGTISSDVNGAITITNGDNATFKDVTLAVKADNGTTVANDHVQLGGILNKPTSITITPGAGSASVPENTLAIENLPQGSTTDKIVVADPATGVLKQVNATMPTFFYMPSIVFDISTAGSFNRNLHNVYIQQFGSPAVSSAGATQGIPTLPANQLEYYVTYYDTDVFENLSIDQNGVLTYTVKATSATGASFMNIVFVVKE